MKSFFHYNRGQRIGILILLGLIGVAFLATVLMPLFIKQPEPKDATGFLHEAEAFKASLIEKERKQKAEREFNPFQYRSYPTYPKFKSQEARYELFAFNPNTADSITFVKLGLRPNIARNILRYRAKGGNFRTAEAFSKVYGISPEKFEELKPYIQIPTADKPAEVTDNKLIDGENKSSQSFSAPAKIDAIIDVNLADTTSLKQVRGIGNTFAKRIVGYRNVLGGYHSIEQLREVFGMNDEIFNKITPYLTIDNPAIVKIDVNKASIEKLRKHPYIKSFKRANAIYEYRRKKVKLNSINQLKHLEEFSEEDWLKLEPYLSFE